MRAGRDFRDYLRDIARYAEVGVGLEFDEVIAAIAHFHGRENALRMFS